MARPQFELGGVLADLRTKKDLLKSIDEIALEASRRIRHGEAKAHDRTVEQSTVSFFGSIKHYLEGGPEV